MGLFRKFRSASNAAPEVSQPASPASTLPDETPPRVSSDVFRPSLHPSPASSTGATKASKRPWSKWKGKEKDDGLGGPAYEDTPRASEKVPLGQGKRDTMVFLGAVRPDPSTSPKAGWGRSESTPILHEGKGRRRDRPESGDFKQEGGLLGRLKFEASPTERSPLDHRRLSRGEGPYGQNGVGRYGNGEVEEVVEGRPSDEVEVLESAEKKQKFWKGRIRRASRAASDVEDEPGSPTPRKTTFNAPQPDSSPIAAKSTTDLVQPRPQTLRRPSSSLFHNPFHRSISRTSLVHGDIDVAVSANPDDGSFQLKSFRHISGTSDFEGPGGLEGYLSHVPRGSIIALDKQLPMRIHTPDPASPVSAPPPAFTTRPSTARQLSRPPSVAASLASVDDIITNSSRIPASAFRKGLRRPSEGPGASEVGHGDDDDDLPLVMVKSRQRTQSSYSLSSLRDSEATPAVRPASNRPSPSPSPKPPSLVTPASETADKTTSRHSQLSLADRPSPSPSPQPDAAPASSGLFMKRNDRVVSGGFVVRSRKGERLVPNTQQSTAGQRSLSSPPITNPPTPSPILGDAHKISDSPIEKDSYFPSIAPALASPAAVTPRSRSWFEVKGNDEEKGSGPPAASTAEQTSPARPPPPVEPVNLPEPGDLTPFDLPLPPDMMPDSPPKRVEALPTTQSLPTSPARNRKLSLLDEPLRVISGLWAGPQSDDREHDNHDDGFDPDLVVSSMAHFGESPRKNQEPEVRPISRATLFDMNKASSESDVHSNRLGHATSHSSLRPPMSTAPSSSSLSRPSLANIRTSFNDDAPSPADSGSSFARAPVRPPVKKQPSTSHLRGKAAWSSSESEGGSASESSVKSRNKRPMKTKGKGVDRQATRKVPGGPRKVSTAVSPVSVRQRRASVNDEGSSSSSSEDESLSVLRARASRSTLSVNQIASPPTRSSALSVSPGKSKLSKEISLAEPESSFKPPTQRRTSRTSAQSSPKAKPKSPRRTSATKTSKSPPKIGARLASLGNKEDFLRGTASPESSQSATSESIMQQPSTPRDPALGLRRGSVPDAHAQGQWHDPQRAPSQMSYPSFDPSQPPPGVDHVQMMNMMKQAWQAHFMAAAYRASEEEWERASVVSGPSQAPSAPQYPVSMGMPFGGMPYSYPQMPGMPPMPGMPGVPGMQGMQGMQMPPPWMFPPFGYPGPASSGSSYGPPAQAQSMYAYGPSTQSVFGGEFGPPSARQTSSSFYAHPPAESQSVYSPAPEYRGHGRVPSNSSTPAPAPSAWRHSSAMDGQWDDAPTPRKVRPATQLIN